MASVNGYTAERMKQIEDNTVVDGLVVSGNLILTKYDGSTINAGNVRGPQGVQGPAGPTTIPTGALLLWSTLTAPSGFLIADGSAVSRTTYAALFTAIATSYGSGDGSTTFNLPNLKGRIPVGTDTTQAEFNAVGKIGGEKTHILTTSEMPSHFHSVDPPSTASSPAGNHYHGSPDGYAFVTTGSGGVGLAFNNAGGNMATTNWAAQGDHAHWTDIAAFNSGSTGTSQAHNVLQPYICLPYIIKT